jgi:hypothetical protein
VHDGIAFERRGIPAAVVCTEPFARMGRATAEVAGLPDYPFLLVPHPMGRLRPEELRVRAETVLAAVIELLVLPAIPRPEPPAWPVQSSAAPLMPAGSSPEQPWERYSPPEQLPREPAPGDPWSHPPAD